MEHCKKSDDVLQSEAREFESLFSEEKLREVTNLLRAIELQPQHAFLWQQLLEHGDLDLVDKATAFHMKNYTAWAVRRRLSIPLKRDFAFLKSVFEQDARNFHAINYLRRSIDDFDNEDQEDEEAQLLLELQHRLKRDLAKSTDLGFIARALLIYPDDVDLWAHWYANGGKIEYCDEVVATLKKEEPQTSDLYGPHIALARKLLGDSIAQKAEKTDELEMCKQHLGEIGENSPGKYMANFLLKEIERREQQ